MNQIQITTDSCIFRGQTVFRGDVVPAAGKADLTPDELGVMVPRLAKLADGKTPKAEPVKEVAEAPKEVSFTDKKSFKRKS
jgi:hypothetical protein